MKRLDLDRSASFTVRPVRRSSALSLLTVIAAFSLLAGCTLQPLPESPKPECTFNSDCTAPKVCGAGGICMDQCREDRDCVEPLVCRNGGCEPQTGQCREDRQCQADEKCSSGACVKKCTTSAECGAGFTCLGGGCVSQSAGCARDNECPSDKVCNSGGKCSAACLADSTCSIDEVCSGGACVPKPKACTGDGDCTAPETCGPSGTCSKPCNLNTDCPSGKQCTMNRCVPLPAGCSGVDSCPLGKACVGMLCTDACVSSRDCRDGLVCSFGVCAAPGTGCLSNTDCSMGKACSPNGDCVTSCTMQADCASGEECSNGACVGSGPTTAKIVGTVTFLGLTDHAGITVTLRGASNVQATTGASGMYSFAGLKPGRYTMVFTAPSTKEREVSLDIAAPAGASTNGPAMAFTPVGELAGNVKMQGANTHNGIQVVLVGQNIGTTTDTNGNFLLRDVPIGTHTLLASAAFYIAAQPTTVPVVYNMRATQPDITLQPAPVTTGSVFSFVTQPPTQAKVGQSYLYTATAGGGGVVGPTYALIDGPPGFTIDPSSGVVTYTPTAGDIGSHYIVLSATGGNATVYQIYYLVVSTPFTTIYNSRAREIDTFGNSTWMTIEYDRKVLLYVDGGTAADGGPVAMYDGRSGDLSGPVSTAVEIINGGAISGVNFQGGTLSTVTGPVGTMTATYPGGTVSNWTSQDLFTLASKSATPNISSISVLDGEVITNFSYPSGPAQSFSIANRVVPSAMTALTGLATGLTSTVLTDSSGSWGSNVLTGLCVTNATASTASPIQSYTATTITVTGTDLTTYLATGQRYFIVNCGNYYGRFTLTGFGDPTVNLLLNRRIDTYLLGQSLNEFVITSNTANTVTFEAPVAYYGELLNVPSNGFVVVSNASNQYPVTMTDATATFAGGLNATNRIAFDGNNSVYSITANTGTTVTFNGASKNLNRLVAPLTWRLTDLSNNTPVTFTFGAASFTAGAYNTRYLWFDPIQSTYQISANTTNTITALIGSNRFPLVGWKNAWAAVVNNNTFTPQYRVTDSAAAYVPNSIPNTAYFYQLPNYNYRGQIYGNTATTVTFSGSSMLIRDMLASTASGPYMVGYNYGSYGRMTLNFSGSPGWAVDSLVNREMFSVDNPNARGRVISNTPSSVLLEFYYSSQQYFDNVSPTSKFALAYLSGSGTPGYRVTLNASGSAFAANAYVGMALIGVNGDYAGNVLSNTATAIDLLVTNTNTLSYLTSGQPFAFSNRQQAGTCGTTYGRIFATVGLTGATLSANAYQNVYINGRNYPVLSNTASTLDVAICGQDFDQFWPSIGQRGIATTNDRVTLTLNNSTGMHPANGLVGQRVVLYDSNRVTPPVISNTATGIAVTFTSSEFNNINSAMAPGARYSIGDVNGETVVGLLTSGLAVDALKSRFIQPFSNSNASLARLVVDSNTATQINVRLSSNIIDNVVIASPPVSGYFASQGLVVRITDSTANFTAGALVGRVLRLNGRELEIIANTPTTITASTSDPYAWSNVRSATAYTVPGMNPTGAVVAMQNGDAVVASNDSSSNNSLYRVRGNSVIAHYNRLSTAQALTLSPATAPIRGVLAGGTFNNSIIIATDSTANWTPNAFAGGILHLRYPTNSSWYHMTILSNTATSITAYCPSSGNVQAGYQYIIEPLRFTVTGTTLTPNALRGARIRINGMEHVVRSNTASEVVLSDLGAYIYNDVPSILTGSTIGYVLNGLRGQYISGLARDGANGFAAAVDDALVRFDGTNWSRIAELESSTSMGTGTITGFSYSQIVDTSANFAVDSLIGRRVRTAVGTFTVNGNTSNTLYLNNSFQQTNAPLPGEAYSLYQPNGFADTNDVSTGPGTLWVASNSGLHKLSSSTWTHYTQANTETMLNLANGMFHNSVSAVAAVSDTEVWTSYGGTGVARLSGSTWTQFTVAKTESMVNKRDGLLSNEVYDFAFEPGGAVWFATDDGVSKLSSNTWTNFGYTQGLPGSFSYDVTLTPSGAVWASSGNSVVKLSP